ncbi:MAG: helix-turn-helix domain-containing protein [Terracoccus sp.]
MSRQPAARVGRTTEDMSISSPYVIVLTPLQRAVLAARSRSRRGQHRDVVQARVVLAAAAGTPNAAIATELGINIDTARTWRKRFATDGVGGLVDRPRSGRPRRFTPVQVAQVKALACTLPAETGLPLARWSITDLAAEAVNRAVAESISASSVRRWLAADAIKPWQHRSWIFPRDPNFEAKAARVLDLYDRRWQGRPLGEHEYVISADELCEASHNSSDVKSLVM